MTDERETRSSVQAGHRNLPRCESIFSDAEQGERNAAAVNGVPLFLHEDRVLNVEKAGFAFLNVSLLVVSLVGMASCC